MPAGSRCFAWLVGLAAASFVFATAAQAAGKCAPCAGARHGECCDHEVAEVPDTDGCSHAAPSGDGHCACSSDDCGPVPTSDATVASHDVMPAIVAPSAAVKSGARAARDTLRLLPAARAPPKRTVVLLL